MLKEFTIISYKMLDLFNQNYQRKVTIFVKKLAKNELKSISGTQKRCALKLEPRDFLYIFLRFWLFEPRFLMTCFLLKNVYFSFTHFCNVSV